jgi:glycerol-3-phosphate dehydrogenase (NAD(P)+)
MRTAILGSGSFGTAIASVLAPNSDEIWMWDRAAEVVQGINVRHENPLYLPGITLPAKVRATEDLTQALAGADLVVAAIPSQFLREVIRRAAPALPKQVPIVSVAKGIENETLLTMTEVLEQTLPDEYHPYIAALSGPSFAKEMVRGLPTVVTIAAAEERVARRCQEFFQTETFRTYTSNDVIGVQYGGALKNVIAIAAGISDGLGFGHNARAALITRGLAEITRMAVRCGANPLTLSGLAGMGDLVLTCTGELSRNRTVGFALGQGQKLKEILAGMNQVAEGVKTAASAVDLSKKTGVEMPISQQVFSIMYEDKDPKAAVYELMTRSPKAELT